MLRFRETGLLTPTETEIVYYLLRGFSQAQIAYVRDRSIKTLSVHKRNICRKVGNATTATPAAGPTGEEHCHPSPARKQQHHPG